MHGCVAISKVNYQLSQNYMSANKLLCSFCALLLSNGKKDCLTRKSGDYTPYVCGYGFPITLTPICTVNWPL